MKVSVFMVTYNHERYVAQAINSVLMQCVNFDYELVIGEDCSTDNTRDIVIEFKERYPDKIRLLLSETNMGAAENARRTRQACQGEYIAVLEGDDYWISPDKLQKQVIFLDSHPECAICFHNVTAVHEDGSRGPYDICPANQKEISTLEDLLLSNFIVNCSVMFRTGLFDELPDWYYALPIGDWPLHIINAQHGKIGYINEVMGVYRVHPGGKWSSLNRARWLQADIEVLGHINAYLDFRYEDIIRTAVLNRWGRMAAIEFEQGAQQGSVQAAISNVMEIFNRWSIEWPSLSAWRAQSLSKIYAGFLFPSYKARDFPMVRYCWVKMVRYDPSWLRNLGVWSIGVEAFFGQHAAGWLRRGITKVRQVYPGNKGGGEHA